MAVGTWDSNVTLWDDPIITWDSTGSVIPPVTLTQLGIDPTMLLRNTTGAQANACFPLSKLEKYGYDSFQAFAHKMGWDTKIYYAFVYFNNLP